MHTTWKIVCTVLVAIPLAVIAAQPAWPETLLQHEGTEVHSSLTRLDRTRLPSIDVMAENACEAEGIEKMINLMMVSNIEAMWAYMADPLDPLRCQWFEIGWGEQGDRVERTTIRVDRGRLRELMAAHATIHLYHFHPLAYFTQCAEATSCGDLSVPLGADGLSKEALTVNLRYALPSPRDVAFMTDVSRELNQDQHRNGTIRHRVITPYGIVEYGLTEGGQQRLERDGMEGTRGRWGFDTYITTRVSYELSETSVILARNPDNLLRAVAQIAENLNNEYLFVTYVPFRN